MPWSNAAAHSPLSPWGRARARIPSAMRGKRLRRVKGEKVPRFATSGFARRAGSPFPAGRG
jgi:hypothetical protein